MRSLPLILVTGPARSGKSEWAEQLAGQSAYPVTYLATAQTDPSDADWQDRIARHRQRRPADWLTLEVPLHLADAIQTAGQSSAEAAGDAGLGASAIAPPCLLVDSLGTWLANLLEQSETEWAVTVETLLTCLHHRNSMVILVAEETGWGVVPAYPLGRLFRDRLGTLTRRIGAIADAVYLVVGGFALDLRQCGTLVDPDWKP